MTSQPEVAIKSVGPATVAFIVCQGPFSGIPEAIGKLITWMGQRGLAPGVTVSGVYYDNPAEVTLEEPRWEMRHELAADVAPEGPNAEGLGVKRVEGAQVAAIMHKGPYDTVSASYGILVAWIAENGYQVVGPPEEVYLSGPTVAPSEVLTEVRLPVTRE